MEPPTVDLELSQISSFEPPTFAQNEQQNSKGYRSLAYQANDPVKHHPCSSCGMVPPLVVMTPEPLRKLTKFQHLSTAVIPLEEVEKSESLTFVQKELIAEFNTPKSTALKIFTYSAPLMSFFFSYTPINKINGSHRI